MCDCEAPVYSLSPEPVLTNHRVLSPKKKRKREGAFSPLRRRERLGGAVGWRETAVIGRPGAVSVLPAVVLGLEVGLRDEQLVVGGDEYLCNHHITRQTKTQTNLMVYNDV